MMKTIKGTPNLFKFRSKSKKLVQQEVPKTQLSAQQTTDTVSVQISNRKPSIIDRRNSRTSRTSMTSRTSRTSMNGNNQSLYGYKKNNVNNVNNENNASNRKEEKIRNGSYIRPSKQMNNVRRAIIKERNMLRNRPINPSFISVNSPDNNY